MHTRGSPHRMAAERATNRLGKWGIRALAVAFLLAAGGGLASEGRACPFQPAPTLMLVTRTNESVLLRWRHDNSAARFTLIRVSLSSRTDIPLDASAHFYSDRPPTTDPFYCYTLLDFRTDASPRRTDLLCVFANTRSRESVPHGFSILLARSNVATVGWSPPGGHTDHVLVALGTSRLQVVDATAISATDNTSGAPTCYALFARSGTTVIGNADVLCAVPGFWADSSQRP